MRRFFAPGRANLIGEHTDYTGGLVLPAAIDRGIILDAEPGGGRIRLTSDSADDVVDVPADGSVAPRGGFGRFVAAVAAELHATGRPAVGLVGSLRSDLPQGAGLSSSAALEVATGLALCAIADHELEPLELAAACRRAERRAVGVPSGIMDQAASVLGRTDHAILLDCGSLAHRTVPLPPDHGLLIIDSGTRRRLESSGYAARVAELDAALAVLDGRPPSHVEVAELGDLTAGLDEVGRRRLRHVVSENARVRDVVAALDDGRTGELAALFASGHASLRDDFEVSTPELDALVELAGEAGATAARMTGGGFGGAVIVLVPRAQMAPVAEQVLSGYRRRFGADRGAAHLCRAADGAGER